MAQVPKLQAPRSAVSAVLAGAIADIWTDLVVVVGMIGSINRDGTECMIAATPSQAYAIPMSVLNDVVANGGRYEDFILYLFIPNAELPNSVPDVGLPQDKALINPADPDSGLRQKTWDEYLDLFSFRKVNDSVTETAARCSLKSTGRIITSEEQAALEAALPALIWRTEKQWNGLVETDPEWQVPALP